jgi:hypothetical protein
VILFDEIIQVFDLTNLDGLTRFLLERLKGRVVGTAFVDGDFEWKAVLADQKWGVSTLSRCSKIACTV